MSDRVGVPFQSGAKVVVDISAVVLHKLCETPSPQSRGQRERKRRTNSCIRMHQRKRVA